MKKILFFVIAMSMAASSAYAVDTAGRFGLGFWTSSAPVGGRYWFSEKAGVDVGVGFVADDNGTDTNTTFRVALGVPITVMNAGDRVNFNIVPAFLYTSFPDGSSVSSNIAIFAALEFEVFVTEDFSVGASHGLSFDITSFDDSSVDSQTDISTFGFNLTDFGFHYYFDAP